jgi:lipopolysaccharide/colanic/teichoic acid biosynthesis glycosyltransferase
MSDSFYAQEGKRWFDAVCAATGLFLLSPFLVFIAIMVKLTSHGPVIFRQVRTGRLGNPFQIWKFRTMTWEPAEDGGLLTAAGDRRVTPFGQLLRKTKCDELPQLFNVLRGEMSLVGPRPEVPRYTNQYTDEQRNVLAVRPGITGPTANRYISEEEMLAGHQDKEGFYLSTILPVKLEMDLQYCQDISFNRDLKLIAHTFTNLLLRYKPVRTVIPDTSGKSI